MRRASLPLLLLFSTLAIAAGYLGMAAAPTLAVACAASVLGGTGNGVQWVAMVSAVQELTTASMQARVISVLESISSAMPAIGFVLGGLIATVYSPRATFAFAGIGVVVDGRLGGSPAGLEVAHTCGHRGRRMPPRTTLWWSSIPAMPAERQPSSPTWRS